MEYTASNIIDEIGPERLRRELSVTQTRIRQARATGQLPASWYDTCEKLTGKTLPRHLFSFKRGET